MGVLQREMNLKKSFYDRVDYDEQKKDPHSDGHSPPRNGFPLF